MWVQVHDVRLSLYEWPGDGPPVLFTHATSFHARCWDAVIAQLPGCHCFAVDQRGHGQSDKPTPPNIWRSFGEDLAALAERLPLQGAIGVGHSLGGFATALAAALVPDAFAALLLIDPVIQPRHLYHGRTAGEHFTARRRNHWPSPEAMLERFAERAPFNRWQPNVLHDYCTYGLLPAENGDGFVLACPPAIEADVYAGTSECDIYPELATVQVPTVVLRADRFNSNPTSDLSSSPTAPDLARHFRHGRDVPLPDHTHFIPMEDPALVAQHVRELLARV
jgi:pimeloyl-ACP methyl ester carboxylesterase